MCIKLHGVPSEGGLVVLDPFVGTGTTAAAAKRLACHYVGFDIDPHYVEIALARLADEAVA
jgi:DNA modification methylase